MTNEEMRKTIIRFNKRFAKGEQDISLKEDGSIVKTELGLTFGIFNKLDAVVAHFKKFYSISDRLLFGRGGLIDQLVPIQKAYNTIKNKKYDLIAKLSFPVLYVEDGSVDIDALEEEGLTPGKVVVYRAGSQVPKESPVEYIPSALECLTKEEDSLLDELDNIIERFTAVHYFDVTEDKPTIVGFAPTAKETNED